jgi:D-alanine transaminase
MRALAAAPPPGQGPGVKLLAMEDFRWKRCWIKSVALLPNVLAKNAAVAAGADEAVFIDDAMVTECAVSNFFAVLGKQVVTHPVGPRVLGGITRQILRDAAQEIGIAWSERPLRQAEAIAADEAFITSTTREISWVSHWNGQPLGGARCGPVTRRLHEALVRIVRSETASQAVAAAAAR